ncbi:hypothetical protein [Bdellovibrio sp. NC01]|uniref:hypothetical protein n=1 Tax=Bdellovibrio sp. NC01 TaxID=2220073 RepID=UPI001FEEF161|nr:hypothetical protein [Bdellovibrio sp. NC01]
MLKSKKSSRLNNEKGMAMFEMIPVMVVVVLFINFALGFFGAIHTGIMNSMSARNYAMGSFSHRANLTYFRKTDSGNLHYNDYKMRVHGTRDESGGEAKWAASTRKIDFFDFGNRPEVDMKSKDFHQKQVSTVCDYDVKGKDCSNPRNENVSVNPIWIKTSYGICLNAACGT